MSGQVFLCWTSTKQRIKCLALGHNAVFCESRTRNPAILSQALYHHTQNVVTPIFDKNTFFHGNKGIPTIRCTFCQIHILLGQLEPPPLKMHGMKSHNSNGWWKLFPKHCISSNYHISNIFSSNYQILNFFSYKQLGTHVHNSSTKMRCFACQKCPKWCKSSENWTKLT